MQSSFIYTADNKPHEVVGSGIVTLLLHNDMEDKTANIHALHVPSLGLTLLVLWVVSTVVAMRLSTQLR